MPIAFGKTLSPFTGTNVLTGSFDELDVIQRVEMVDRMEELVDCLKIDMSLYILRDGEIKGDAPFKFEEDSNAGNVQAAFAVIVSENIHSVLARSWS